MKKNEASKVLEEERRAEERAGAKVLRQKKIWYALGRERKQHGERVVSKGESGRKNV